MRVFDQRWRNLRRVGGVASGWRGRSGGVVSCSGEGGVRAMVSGVDMETVGAGTSAVKGSTVLEEGTTTGGETGAGAAGFCERYSAGDVEDKVRVETGLRKSSDFCVAAGMTGFEAPAVVGFVAAGAGGRVPFNMPFGGAPAMSAFPLPLSGCLSPCESSLTIAMGTLRL